MASSSTLLIDENVIYNYICQAFKDYCDNEIVYSPSNIKLNVVLPDKVTIQTPFSDDGKLSNIYSVRSIS